jgi:predicted RNA binding protein YcfA (HicA-like mRNA interferase family)
MGDKYPLLTPAQLIRVLRRKDFVFKSQRGSHAKYSDGLHTAIVPMHDEIARGTLRAILLQAGMTLQELLDLL